jgi:tetratricopeptide (TPR) repeat protein
MSAPDDPQLADDVERAVLASGQRAVAIDGNAPDAVIVTGDNVTIGPTRRTLWLIGATLAGVAVVAALVLIGFRQQHKAATEAAASLAAMQEKQDQLTAIQNQLAAAIAPKLLAQGQTKPDPLPPELIEKAKLLLDQGSAEQQALAKIALNQHDEANRIIQELKARPDNPIDEAFHLLMLEGDNWYQAGEHDKAIEPYEKALALRPDDFSMRNNVVMAHIYARLGSIADHLHRAIELAEGTLKMVSPRSERWAMTQEHIGVAWAHMPTGDQDENLRKSVGYYEAALTAYTKEANPTDWALTHIDLGVALSEMQTGDAAEQTRRAIGSFKAALLVVTSDFSPIAHAKLIEILEASRQVYELLPESKDKPFASIAPAG